MKVFSLILYIFLESTAWSEPLGVAAGAGMYFEKNPAATPVLFFAEAVVKLTTSKLRFIPEIGYIWTEDVSNSKRYQYYLNLEAGYQISEAVRFRTGPGFLFRTTSGSGGSIRDSTSSGSPYMNPGQSRTGHFVTWNVGVEAQFLKSYLARVEAFVLQLFDSQHRQINFLFTGGLLF